MSDQPHEPEQLLETLLSDDEPQDAGREPAAPEEDEDVDLLIDELEAMFAEAKRVPFGRKLMIDEAQALELVDRFRSAIPAEVRQAHRILDEQERIVEAARDQARRILHDRGLLAELEAERERVLAQAERDAERMRTEADAYVRGVLSGLAERLSKLQASVNNGLEALSSSQSSS
ncbi:MAG: hypothetical protein M3380_10245 [Chloroflexota bacterium]|nr:hypothetical protein [Chloroflexota bacterium]